MGDEQNPRKKRPRDNEILGGDGARWRQNRDAAGKVKKVKKRAALDPKTFKKAFTGGRVEGKNEWQRNFARKREVKEQTLKNGFFNSHIRDTGGKAQDSPRE